MFLQWKFLVFSVCRVGSSMLLLVEEAAEQNKIKNGVF